MKKLIMSDVHLHNWTTFSSTNEEGINERLKITLDEMYRACLTHETNGGDKVLIIAGDVFHTRGAVKTSVINSANDMFSCIKEVVGYDIHILSGNHDLESKESERLSSAVTNLEKWATVYSESYVNVPIKTVFVPWFSSVERLKAELGEIVNSFKSTFSKQDISNFDLVIHAPVDDVIIGLPDHGLDSDYLSKLGFKRVFSGHYHHHKNFGNGVYSIGALTHQTFSDIGSKAGHLVVSDSDVIFNPTHAPRFIDINENNFDDAQLLVDGNYVRCRVEGVSEEEKTTLRNQFIDWGAKGVMINHIKSTSVIARTGVVSSTKVMTLRESVSNYVMSKYSVEVDKFCQSILDEVEI